MPSATELLAHDRTTEEMCDIIGADKLIFQDLPDLIDAVQKKGKTNIQQFDCSVFNGEYVTGDVNSEYLEQLELLRNDAAKSEQEGEASVLDLHNTE